MPRAQIFGIVGIAILFGLIPPVAGALGGEFYIDLGTRIMIYATAALGLNLILSFGSMVSFGHAAFLGIGGYVIGISSYFGIYSGPLQFALVFAVSACVALGIGAVSLRTKGLYFVMITLAFGQLFYLLSTSIYTFGGEDGMQISAPSDFGKVLDLGSTTTIYYVAFAFLVLILLLSMRVVTSPFGLVLRGSMYNEERLRALGLGTYKYKLAAFVASGVIVSLAGALLANLTLFVSPDVMSWMSSGDLLIMVIIGGVGSLVGPVFGATAFLIMQNVFSSWTAHWQGILGPLVVLIVLFRRRDAVRAMFARVRKRSRRLKVRQHVDA